MLSILIPVYNEDITKLVSELISQCDKEEISYEILALNDASPIEAPAIVHPNFSWLENPSNLGRSKSRNTLATSAKFNHLIFLDADTFPENENFIKNYLLQIDHPVVCGGIIYEETLLNKAHSLRWNYGRKHETVRAKTRNKNEYTSFMTGNFLCHKSIFNTLRFDASLLKYGHEDTLFGKELLENAIEIRHIDNPVFHLGLEPNEKYMEKVKESLESLSRLYDENKITRHYSSLIKTYERLTTWGVWKVFILALQRLKENWEKELAEKGAPVWKLQFLKLCWWSEIRER